MTAIESLIEQLEAFANERSSNQSAEAAQQVAEELTALQAIYGEESIGLLTVQKTQTGGISTVSADEAAQNSTNEGERWVPSRPIRLALTIPLDVSNSSNDNEEPITIRLSATLPSGYPLVDASPQLQLLSRYIGPHGVDHQLFGRILRIFIPSEITESQHVRFEKGQVALFDGIEKARELIETWYTERQVEKPSQGTQSDDQDKEKHLYNNDDDDSLSDQVQQLSFDDSNRTDRAKSTSTMVKLVTSPAISERKSTFVGHAAALHDPADVPIILGNLLQDRRIARATHPTMYAWVCKVKDENGSGKGVNVVHRDCDDDGETAAGGRLAHLLDLCHVENAIVIVTRWYGGVHLGADRFKLINRAARDALELAGLVDGPLNPSKGNNNTKGRKDH
ncbi:ribosomal protein S5 domain 2-like protein [Meira miltonrushii]|uniref:Ribosomal protein S5 domain 2-like protein n=1 Tax=Meira miltonrushii TaxID=1280837 RepID=A0A316V3H7_9BASI|nr:ribosomal protein S5 domain 2-like protein [Meira miltonrushii]PWN32117.1 ribosomal protein S5 domain 2-like protein [Meira miltonrushii]